MCEGLYSSHVVVGIVVGVDLLDASLWEAMYCLSDLDDDNTIERMVMQLVLVDDVVRKYIEWYFHIFVLCNGHAEIEVFDVEAHVACSWDADCAVP